MKKIFYIFAIMALSLMSCSEQIDISQVVPEDCILLNVYNSPMTKATNEGVEYERQLNRLDCFFYIDGEAAAGGNCIYYQKVDVAQIGQAEIPIYVNEATINTIFPPTATTCDVLVIANLPSGTFESGGDGTDVTTLGKTLLELDGTYDAVDKSFVMAGLGTATKGEDNNASGTIPLYRAAAKVTVSVNVPSQMTVEVDGEDVIMSPVFLDDLGNSTLKTSFHNGVTKTYLREDYVDADGASLTVEEDFFDTSQYGYTQVSVTNVDTYNVYKYTCDVPFYTYARAWEKGASDAAYLTLELPWKNETEQTWQTYYYQILVNASSRNFEPNHWYDLTINIGVLGSTVKAEPKEIKDLTYYVLDWTTEPESTTGDRYENVNIESYTYLIIQDHYVEINNEITGVIRYDASHKLGWKMNTDSKTDEILGTSTDLSAFYYNCGGSTPELTSLPITVGNFTDDGKGVLTYSYTIPDNVYSPVYVYLQVWLDLDGDGLIDNNEAEFTEEVTIVQYPAIYIIPDESCEESVYVNNNRATTTTVEFDGVKLGSVKGSSDGNYMYVVTVSSFKESDTFSLESGSSYNYIIGDPRQVTIDNNMSTTYTFTDNWVEAPATYPNSEYVNNAWTNTRQLSYYYPTASDAAAFQVIAPKFRVVSFNSTVGGANNVDKAGAPLRCASYQEDGFPAGRWRVPTAAEINYIIYLQQQNAIAEIFVGGTNYFCSTGTVSVNNGYQTGLTTGSVRCVYDEWYWGSEREAKKNPNAAEGDADEYLFTWGDEPR